MISAHKLTRRESEILDYIYAGKTDTAIATLEYVSLGTVKTHTRRIFSKTGTSGRVELLAKKIQEQQQYIDTLRREMDALQALCDARLELLQKISPLSIAAAA